MDTFTKYGIAGVIIWLGLYTLGENLYLGCFLSVFPIVLLMVNGMFVEHGSFPTREQGHKDVRYLMGELTPEEEAYEESRERHSHNKNAQAIAFWSMSEDYIDYDGNSVRIED